MKVTKPDGTEARAAALTALLGEAPKPDDHPAVRDFMHRLAEAGCAVLMVYPDSKMPADMRTPRKRSADDKAARDAAKAAGDPSWPKKRSRAGVHLATTDPAVLDGYLDNYIASFGDSVAVNLAVAAGPSRLVVVDADTPKQVAAFGADSPPTVATPGQRDAATGAWVHSDGGHWWFTAPEDTKIPDGVGSLTIARADAGGDISAAPTAVIGDRYVLIPPSTRPEGAYTVTGTVEPLPAWLADAVTEHGQARAAFAERTRSQLDGDDPVQAWGASTSWGEILADAAGWSATGKPDSCGCETWTAPGDHASPKSATAHEPGCGQWIDSPDPPLRIWTDHHAEPFERYRNGSGQLTVSRFQAVAAIHYDDDMGAAMGALLDSGYGDDAADALVAEGMEDFDAGRADGAAAQTGNDALENEVRKRLLYLQADREARRRLDGVEVAEIELPPVRGLAALLAEPDDGAEFMVDQVIPEGGSRIVLSAPAKAGKTTLIGNLARSLVDGDPFLGAFEVHRRVKRLAIIDNEMNDTMLRRWLRAQDIENVSAVADVQAIRGRIGEFDITDDRIRGEWVRRFRDLGIDYLILDCLAPMVEGLGLNPNTEVRKFLQPFDALLAEAGIPDALIAHHMGHTNERARGDSNIIGWPDGNWKIVRGGDNPDDEGADKFFSAFVRGGEVASGGLTFDPMTRRLIYTGVSRSEAATNKTVEERVAMVVQVLADKAAEADGRAGPGQAAPDTEKEMTVTAIKAAVGGNKEITDRAIRKAEGTLIFLRRSGKAKFYRINPDGERDRKAKADAAKWQAISEAVFPGRRDALPTDPADPGE